MLAWFVLLRLFVKSFTADNKYSRCNLHILIQIQTPLSLKQKTFSRFFIAVLKCAWNLEKIESWESYVNYFQNYILQKSWLLKHLKDLASEHHSVNNVLTVSKTAEISRALLLSYFSMNYGNIELEKVFVSLICYLKTVCSVIDCG